jgi:SSS family transporter
MIILHYKKKGTIMKFFRHIAMIFFCLGSLFVQNAHSEEEAAFLAEIFLGSLPQIDQGAVVGRAGEWMVMGGGVSENGSISQKIWVSKDGKEWQERPWPHAIAHAATISTTSGLIVIGGWDGQRVLSQCCEIKVDVGGQIMIVQLPSLPKALMSACAVELNGSIYLAGGLENETAQSSSDLLWRRSASGNWDVVDKMPYGMASALGAVVNDEIVLMGGKDSAGQSSTHVITWRNKPIDGTTATGWREGQDMPLASDGAGLLRTGQAHVALLGGKSLEGVTPDIWVYHTLTDTWSRHGQVPEALSKVAVWKSGEMWTLSDIATGKMWTLTARKVSKSLGALDYTVIVVYFLLMALIGVYFSAKQTSSDEFALGGRNVKWWAAGISMFTTGASSISFMAIPAQAFASNLVWFTPVLLFIPLYFLQAYVIFPLLAKLRITSTYEYLELRFHPGMRYVASGQNVLFQLLGRMSVVLLLPSLAISAVTGLNVYYSVLAMGVLTTIYTSFGGFEAVIWTDVIQGIMMLGGAALMIVLAITGLPGGWNEFVSVNQQYQKFDMAIWEWDTTLPLFWISALAMVMQNLAFAGDQTTVQRVFATPIRDVRKLAAIFLASGLIISLFVNVAGISIFAWFHGNPSAMDVGMKTDQIVPLYIIQRLPSGVAGLIIAALFAASMSTLSSSMNSTATIFVEDFYRKWKPDCTDRERLLIMKWGSIVVGVVGTLVALYMAAQNIQSMFKTWNVVVALLGGGFSGIYILGMFTVRASFLGSVTGAVTSIVVVLYLQHYTTFHWLFYVPAAVITCFVVGYGVSLLLPQSDRDMTGLTAFTVPKDS